VVSEHDSECSFQTKTKTFETVFNGDTAYITHLKQQKSKRGYYLGACWHYGDVLQKQSTFLIFAVLFVRCRLWRR